MILQGSQGQLLPFLPFADEGIDVLFLNKRKDESYPVQVKAAYVCNNGKIQYGGIKLKEDATPNKILVLIYSPNIDQMPEKLWIIPYEMALEKARGKNGTIWLDQSNEFYKQYEIPLGKDVKPSFVVKMFLQLPRLR